MSDLIAIVCPTGELAGAVVDSARGAGSGGHAVHTVGGCAGSEVRVSGLVTRRFRARGTMMLAIIEVVHRGLVALARRIQRFTQFFRRRQHAPSRQ